MGIFDDIAGLFGGGGSSSSVTSTVNLNVNGLDKIGVTETVELKPIEIKPLTVTENANIDLKPIEIKPLTITQNENIDVKPLTINENVDVKPLTITQNENIDLQPVAVDTCQTLRLAPLPDTTVCNPYHHHVAMTLFGLEFMALRFNGQTEQDIRSPRRPRATERTQYPDRGHRPPPPHVVGEGRGLRIRVLDDHDG